MGSLTLQHLSGYIRVAKHRCLPCYPLLRLILIVHLLPVQSNDEVSRVFVLVGGDLLCYSLEMQIFPWEHPVPIDPIYRVCLRPGYPKIVMVFVTDFVFS